jgi:hypothetical protein
LGWMRAKSSTLVYSINAKAVEPWCATWCPFF